jgi:hypothetical protein
VTPIPCPAERLALLIDGLCAAIAAQGARGLLTVPLMLLLWSRLRRMAHRARRLAIRIAAGAPLATPRPRTAPRAAPSRPYVRLPRGVTWLVRVVPGTAIGAATLASLLDDPAMAAIAHTPPMRRLLRPLCRMLGVRPLPTPGPVTPAARAVPSPPADPPARDHAASPPPAISRNAA